MAPAAWEADRRPRWPTKAATRRTSRAVGAADRRAGRKKDLLRGQASAKLTGGLLPRPRTGVATRHATGRPGREGVPYFAHRTPTEQTSSATSESGGEGGRIGHPLPDRV